MIKLCVFVASRRVGIFVFLCFFTSRRAKKCNDDLAWPISQHLGIVGKFC